MSSFFVPLPGSTAPSFRSSTLLLPQPSLSSLAQLSADLLVHNCPFELVGYLGLSDFVPAVGGRDGLPGKEAKQEFSFSCEAYHLPAAGSRPALTLVLPRSPVIVARREHYLRSLKQWVEQEGVEELLVVAGVDAALRGDDALASPTPLRHFLLPTPSSSPSSSTSTLASRLASVSPAYLVSPTATQLPLFPHGGLTRRLLSTFLPSSSSSSSPSSSSEQAPSPTVGALTIYTAEGDALPSAFLLADALSYVLQLEDASQAAGVEEAVAIERLKLSQAEAGVDLADVAAAAAAGAGQGGGEGSGRKWKTPKSWERGLMGVELNRDVGKEMFG
ncbi:hypothetical protein JCM8547_005899 [Rhodosporidiobolus lusitaniae]